ncbi:MAG: hypothetical protein COV29_00815 [Candidatus Yanofskybacteria bacterium CG10_big_fil_rev_8_21_14_0_10_36_16]|uniref:Uncharacterized protein n=1 Tax=Candidatus Yanofskybacteria bacterium CG10_big_fil_rev_8_21_14_0_10_36_16 TaxID=1975096 RepID=A0A2J0Q811_9BACT|nr:MAG: hypothetical protein COV29_00815 [Candidatus Yanofskybacteria bacterium CG10_big_fil_rev_8_21_14_0_10_36_16]
MNKELEENVLAYSIDKRMIWMDIRNSITNRTAFSFGQILKALNRKSNRDIKFFITGVGGDFFAALKMIGLIKSSQSKVTIVAHKFVRSACFTMTQAENTKEVLATKDTEFMFHRAIGSTKTNGKKFLRFNRTDHFAMMEWLGLMDGLQAALFINRGTPISKIMGLFYEDATISFQECKQLKLIDGCFDEEELEDIKKDLHNWRHVKG